MDNLVSLQVPSVYKPLFVFSDRHLFELVGGRLSGKTCNTVLLAMEDLLSHPYFDWLILKAHYSDFQDSDYTEILAVITEHELGSEFEVSKKPLQIRRRNGAGLIYFKGADTIGKDNNRTHGLKTIHPLRGAIFSETQQFRTADAFEEAMASVRRNFTTKPGEVSQGWRIIIQGNPPQSGAHWFNVWTLRARRDPDYTVIDSSYMDILPFINDIDLMEVRKMKALDSERYDWLYMGKVGGGWGTCYPMLTKEFHLIPQSRAEVETNRQRVMGIVIGCDSGVARDATSFCPFLVLEDGSLVARQDEMFFYDPKRNGVMSSFEICQHGNDLTSPAWKWFYGFYDNQSKWHRGISQKYPSVKDPSISVPMWFFYDSAAPELGKALQVFYGTSGLVAPVHKGTITQMVEVCQTAFGKGLVRFIDCAGYWDYWPLKCQANVQRLPVWVSNGSYPTFDQLMSLRFDSSGLRYDNTIPNDASDGATYAIWQWFKNPTNLMYGDIIRRNCV